MSKLKNNFTISRIVIIEKKYFCSIKKLRGVQEIMNADTMPLFFHLFFLELIGKPL